MDPGHELLPITRAAAQAQPHQVEERLKCAASVWAHRDCASQGDLPRAWSLGPEEGLFPAGRHVIAEAPRCGDAWLVASNLAIDVIHRPISCVAVDRCRAGIHPEFRRCGRPSDCRTQVEW